MGGLDGQSRCDGRHGTAGLSLSYDSREPGWNVALLRSKEECFPVGWIKKSFVRRLMAVISLSDGADSLTLPACPRPNKLIGRSEGVQTSNVQTGGGGVGGGGGRQRIQDGRPQLGLDRGYGQIAIFLANGLATLRVCDPLGHKPVEATGHVVRLC